MTPFRTIAVLAFLSLGATVWFGCAADVGPKRLQHFLLSASERVTVRVVCNGEPAYSLDVKVGVPIEIAGPEALCTFIPDLPVEIELDPVWITEGAE